MAFKPFCSECNSWHRPDEVHRLPNIEPGSASDRCLICGGWISLCRQPGTPCRSLKPLE